MTPGRPRRRSRKADAPPAAPASGTERRVNATLREILDDLVQHVRVVARTLDTMTPTELAHAQERLEWLADEVWRAATEGVPFE